MDEPAGRPQVVLDRPFGTMPFSPSATVIIVVWRVDGGLERCLRGLVDTVDLDTEVVIVGNAVDPGASVGVLEAAGFSGRVLGLAENRGPSPARNAAAASAQSGLLVFLDDDAVPVSESRQLVNAHGSAEMSLFDGAGHRLRHDPRAVAVLIGWLDRMRSTIAHPSAELT